ncbi:hypothetical protein [Arenimonas metalli]|uniref:hypothetical protein n=1 Tax=Arenimonas metalli TaxID=948077 RepID=UPI0012EB7898|nr:hypothetical protein [Arenimonas metalli]
MRSNAVLAGAIGFVLSVAANASEPSADWDLKGLRLGASVDEVKELFPAAACEAEPHDAGLVYCLDRRSSLGGTPAFLAVKLLDGQTVNIALENISYDQMRAAVPTLIEKFGEPEYSESIADNVLERRGEKTVVRERHVWTGDNDAVVIAKPFDWSNERRRVTYSSIILMSEAKQKEWAVRFNAKERATDL